MLHIARVKDKDVLPDLGHHVQVAGAARGSGGFPPQPPAFTKALDLYVCLTASVDWSRSEA